MSFSLKHFFISVEIFTQVASVPLSLAHSGAHPEQNRLLRRLRTHFYMKGIDKIVEEFINKCKFCQLSTQNTTKHPIEPNRVPERCWDETSMDLFGPHTSKTI